MKKQTDSLQIDNFGNIKMAQTEMNYSHLYGLLVYRFQGYMDTLKFPTAVGKQPYLAAISQPLPNVACNFFLLSITLCQVIYGQYVWSLFRTDYINAIYNCKEKYNNFIETYNDIHHRIPLGMIASYLGITQKILSRIQAEK